MELTTAQKRAVARYMLEFSPKALMEDLDILWENKDPDSKADVKEVRKALEDFGAEIETLVLETL